MRRVADCVREGIWPGIPQPTGGCGRKHDAVAYTRIKTHGKTYWIIIGRATGTPSPRLPPAAYAVARPVSLAGSYAHVRFPLCLKEHMT